MQEQSWNYLKILSCSSILLCIGIISSCNREEQPLEEAKSLFSMVSPQKSGVVFKNSVDPYGTTNMINYLYAFNGGGVGVGDLDNDGLSDIVFTANQGSNKIYFNKGEFNFDEQTLGEEESPQWSTGITLVDINSDGLKDIYICNVNNGKELQGQNQLFINYGNRTFKEAARDYNLDIKALSTQSAFLDYDKDGDLDMFLLCHSTHSPSNYSDSSVRSQYSPLGGDRLLENRNGKYVDVSKEKGIYQSNVGYGLGVAVADVNLDGWLDIYVANDFHENDFLYVNDGMGGFVETSQESFSHTSKFSMGCNIADVNGDMFPDIFSLDMRPEDEEIYKVSEAPDLPQTFDLKYSYGYNKQFARNALQLNAGIVNAGVPFFQESGSLYEVESTDWSWSPLIGDFNLDGYQDIFITNGIYRRPNNMDYLAYISNDIVQESGTDSTLIEAMPEGKQKNYLYLGKENGFENQSDLIEDNKPDISQGAAYADLDNDGDLDLIINRYNETAQLLENKTERKSFKLDFRKLKSAESSGAKIVLYTSQDNYYKELIITNGFQSSMEDVVVFGVKDNESLDSCIVYWNDNSFSTFRNIAFGKSLEVEKKNRQQGNYSSSLKQKNTDRRLDNVAHVENDFDDFVQDDLLLSRLGWEGPAFASGDVNGDGISDFFIGGASGSKSAIYFGSENGYQRGWSTQEIYEDVDAVFGDLDKDGDLDLIVAAGGGQMPDGHPQNTNRIYFNDGNGEFKESYYYVDTEKSNTGATCLSDVDGDGWLDVFFGGRSIVGAFGLTPRSELLRNIRGREFVAIPDARLGGLSKTGMITDAIWTDLNGDQKEELVVVGHWMPITIFWNTGEGLEKYEVPKSSGLYNCVKGYDIDKNGHIDLLFGNIGLNHNLYGDDYKLNLVINDFNKDTLIDHFPTYKKLGVELPAFHKSVMEGHFNGLKKSINTYEDYATRDVRSLFDEELTRRSFVRTIDIFESGVLFNQGNKKLELNILPRELQGAPIHAITAVGDDFLFAGGDHSFRPLVGHMSSRLIQSIKYKDGLWVTSKIRTLIDGQVRGMKVLSRDKNELLIIRNNGPASLVTIE